MPATLKSRALVVARNLPPLQGGIERLMRQAIPELSADWACEVLGPTGCAAHVPAAVAVTELPPAAVPFLLRAAAHVARRPRGARLVLASSGVMAPVARLAALRNGCPYVVWIHGLDVAYRNPVYRTFALPAIRAAARVIANSWHTARLAVAAGVEDARIRVIAPGVDATSPVSDADAAAFAARRGLAGAPLLLFVGRLVERKGLVEFVERALPAVLRACPGARLLVVGAEPGYADAPSGPYRERIGVAATRAGVAGAVVLAGALPDAELQLAYAAADALVFPVVERPGDVEGFGMVAVEAAAQGTPTVAFAVGGVPDAVSADSGTLVSPGDYAGMAAALVGELRGSSSHSPERCRAHARAHGWDRYGAAIRAVCREAAGMPA